MRTYMYVLMTWSWQALSQFLVLQTVCHFILAKHLRGYPLHSPKVFRIGWSGFITLKQWSEYFDGGSASPNASKYDDITRRVPHVRRNFSFYYSWIAPGCIALRDLKRIAPMDGKY